MVEAVFLQIPLSIRKVFQVRVANHCDSIMYAEHVLLHGLILLLLNLIQGPYHGIIVTLVTEHLLHVHQQVLHRDILVLVQCASPFTRVPMETGKNMRVHACLIILLKEGIHVNLPECVHHFRPWISRLEDCHIQSCRCPLLLLPTPSVAPTSMLMACGLTCSGVTIRVQSGEEGGKAPPPTTVHWYLGGCLHGCAAPAQVVSLALAVSSTVEDLLACWGALPTSCTEESDSPAFTTGILGTRFSAWLLSLWWSEAATAHHHASIRGRRLMVKWAECEIHPEKASST